MNRPVIEKRPTVAPQQHPEPTRETPARTPAPREVVAKEPKPPVVVKQGVGEKSGSETIKPVVTDRPELLTVQQKVKRMNQLDQTNQNSTAPKTAPVQRVAVQQLKPKIEAVLTAPKAVPPQAHASLELASLSKTTIKLNKVLKGNTDKLTCLVDVAGVSYVVKAGQGYTTMADHIANTDLFIRLNIPGVRAPLTKELTADFRNSLKRQLDPNDPSEKQLLDALGTFDQISAVAPGLAVQDVFNPDNASISDLLTTIQGKNSENSALALTAKLEEALKAKNMDGFNGRPIIPELKDPATRSAAIKKLKPLLNIGTNKQILSVLENVSQQGADKVIQTMTAEVSKLASAKTKLTDYAKSDAGGYALGGMCVMDLLVGMDDRIVGGKFNGGNFMFDPVKNQLWCVDNSKDPKYALSATDADAAWKVFALRGLTDDLGGVDPGQTMSERLHWVTYDRATQDPSELSQNVQLDAGGAVATQAGMQRAVTETLQKMHALVNNTGNGLPASERAKLSARLDFLEARKTFTDLLNLDPVFQSVPLATKPGLGTILKRNVVSAVKGRAPDEKQAEIWKNEARDPATTDEALEGIDQVLSIFLANPINANADQRFFKALFAVRSERFRRDLKSKSDALKHLAATGNKAWGEVDRAVIKRQITDTSDLWVARAVALKDKDVETALTSTVNELGKLLNSQF